MNEAIAQTIKELRKQKNSSQETLAESIDSNQVYISEIENAKKNSFHPYFETNCTSLWTIAY